MYNVTTPKASGNIHKKTPHLPSNVLDAHHSYFQGSYRNMFGIAGIVQNDDPTPEISSFKLNTRHFVDSFVPRMTWCISILGCIMLNPHVSPPQFLSTPCSTPKKSHEITIFLPHNTQVFMVTASVLMLKSTSFHISPTHSTCLMVKSNPTLLMVHSCSVFHG